MPKAAVCEPLEDGHVEAVENVPKAAVREPLEDGYLEAVEIMPKAAVRETLEDGYLNAVGTMPKAAVREILEDGYLVAVTDNVSIEDMLDSLHVLAEDDEAEAKPKEHGRKAKQEELMSVVDPSDSELQDNSVGSDEEKNEKAMQDTLNRLDYLKAEGDEREAKQNERMGVGDPIMEKLNCEGAYEGENNEGEDVENSS
eukprot:9040211-Alexandrium_andersonii.AAC.1